MTWKVIDLKKRKAFFIQEESPIYLNKEKWGFQLEKENKNDLLTIISSQGFLFFKEGDAFKSFSSNFKISYIKQEFLFEKNTFEDEKYNSFCKSLNPETEDILSSFLKEERFLNFIFSLKEEISKNHSHYEKYRNGSFLSRKVSDFLSEFHHNSKNDLILNHFNRNCFFIIFYYLKNKFYGFDVLDFYLNDNDISEIIMNDYNEIHIEKSGTIRKTPLHLLNRDEYRSLVERICASSYGRTINARTPYCDSRLHDGSRVHAIIPPASKDTIHLTIRKFLHKKLTAEKMIELGSVSEEIILFLKEIVKNKKNILFSGGTSTGKTSFLNVISQYIPHSERVITIEDCAELKLQQPHVVSLESRTNTISDIPSISIRDLLKNSLRMRPDRIIVGECRGEEALEMLQAMNTGHEGSMTTIHANTPDDAISRLETLASYGTTDIPFEAIRKQIFSSLDYVVQLKRTETGFRYLDSIFKVDKTKKILIPVFKFISEKRNWVFL